MPCTLYLLSDLLSYFWVMVVIIHVEHNFIFFNMGFMMFCSQQSKFITAKEGKERGLVDALCSPDELIKMSRLWALEIANYRKPWIRSLARTDRLGSLSEARSVLNSARQQAKKVAANLPQHQACLDVMEEGVLCGGHAGVLKVCTFQRSPFIFLKYETDAASMPILHYI